MKSCTYVVFAALHGSNSVINKLYIEEVGTSAPTTPRISLALQQRRNKNAILLLLENCLINVNDANADKAGHDMM